MNKAGFYQVTLAYSEGKQAINPSGTFSGIHFFIPKAKAPKMLFSILKTIFKSSNLFCKIFFGWGGEDMLRFHLKAVDIDIWIDRSKERFSNSLSFEARLGSPDSWY